MEILTDNNQLRMSFGCARQSSGPLWRPIHYLGSKLRLAENICELTDQLDPSGGRVCDVFAGSGTVAMALARTRTVVAADIQEYSRVLCSAVLKPAFPDNMSVDDMCDSLLSEHDEKLAWCLSPLLDLEASALESAHSSPSMLCDIVEHGSIILGEEPAGDLGRTLQEVRNRIATNNVESSLVVSRYFGGVYFSYSQSLAIDHLLLNIRALHSGCRDTALAALLSSASSLVNTIGSHFAQPIRPRNKDGVVKHHLVSKMVRDRLRSIRHQFDAWMRRYYELPRGGDHAAVQGDYGEVLASLDHVAIVYADPPYTRDHYSRFYHVLETIARQDSPGVTTTSLRGVGAKSRGVYRPDRHQSPFSIRSQAPAAFDQLFRCCRRLHAAVLLSYSPYVKNGHPRMMSIAGITDLAARYYPKVDVVSAGEVSHSKLNRIDLHLETGDEAEVFILCR